MLEIQNLNINYGLLVTNERVQNLSLEIMNYVSIWKFTIFPNVMCTILDEGAGKL